MTHLNKLYNHTQRGEFLKASYIMITAGLSRQLDGKTNISNFSE